MLTLGHKGGPISLTFHRELSGRPTLLGAAQGILCCHKVEVSMVDRQQLHSLVDQLPESEVLAAERYLEFLTGREAPIDREMLARIDADFESCLGARRTC
jgi:hypothetical protein